MITKIFRRIVDNFEQGEHLGVIQNFGMVTFEEVESCLRKARTVEKILFVQRQEYQVFVR